MIFAIANYFIFEKPGRPVGTWNVLRIKPGVETPGYCHPSLRDNPHGERESSAVPLKIRAIKKAASVSEGRLIQFFAGGDLSGL